MYLVILLILCSFAIVSSDHGTNQVINRPLEAPPVATSWQDYLELNDECLRTSKYFRPKGEFVCKNLGKCYQYHCKRIAQKCGSCANGKGPCNTYDITVESSKTATSRRKKRKRRKAGKAWKTIFQYSRKKRNAHTNLPVYIENLGNAIVHLQTGDTNCAGFVTSVRHDNMSFVITTAAQCLVKYEVECEDTYPWRLEDRVGNSSGSCFGDSDMDVSRVTKQFRSYFVTITSYAGNSYTIPLNSATAMVPRNYLECENCNYDSATLKIDEVLARKILGSAKPLQLLSASKPNLMTSSLALITVKSGYPSHLLRRATRLKLCMVNQATKQQMCVQIPLLHNEHLNTSYLPGSPVIILPSTESGTVEVVGIYTGFDSTISGNIPREIISPQTKAEGIVNVTSQIISAVRISDQLIRLIENFISRNSSEVESILRSARHDCFPSSIRQGEMLCLCSRGWKNEMGDCLDYDISGVPDGCFWNPSQNIFRCLRNALYREADTLGKIIIPGNTDTLDLRFQGIEKNIDIIEMLRRLQFAKRIILDYNSLQILQNELFVNNGYLEMLSLKNNKLIEIPYDILSLNYNLTSVSFANNQLGSIPRDVFWANPKLRKINLQGNQIKSLHNDTFMENTQLTTVLLSRNILMTLPKTLFTHNINLKEVWLDFNRLTSIPRHLFSKLTKLILVNLSYNNLITLHPVTFGNCVALQYVNLNYNKLRKLPTDLFQNQTNLQTITTVGNPLLTV